MRPFEEFAEPLSVKCSPGFITMNAAGTSPHCASGADTTAHSSTAGCAAIARSTSIDEIFSPPQMMMSFLRSTMCDVAFVVPHRHVAGVEPAAGHHVGGGLAAPCNSRP